MASLRPITEAGTTRNVAGAAICVLMLAACGSLSVEPSAPGQPPAWNHDADDPTLGPGNWGAIDDAFETCLTGASQSPIDIVDAVPADLPPLEFDYSATALVVENTGHVIEVPMPEGSDHMLTIEGEAYRLVQYHFHAPSEHTLDGESFDVEAHLVHQNDEGELAVVGVFLDLDGSPSPLLDSVMTNAPAVAGVEVIVDEEWSPLALVPVEGSSVEVSSYYTYSGSLTTPGCTEGVRWIVLEDTLGASAATTNRLHELISGFPGYDEHEDNNRPTQALHDREVERAEQ